MYNNQKAPKQPKVTSDNAMAIARSKSATDAQSKAWDSRYVADAIVNVVDDDHVSLTFTTPLRMANHVGDQFAPDITSAIGDKSMKYFNRFGATLMSFQKKGTLKGEVEEPWENASTKGEKFNFRLTGEEMKAAFTYINAKRKHTYTPGYNSATFAAHAMKAAGISINASSAKSLKASINKEIDREETNGEKTLWNIYSYVKGADEDKKDKEGGKRLRAYDLGYEQQTSAGEKNKVSKIHDGTTKRDMYLLDRKLAYSDLINKFTTNATLNALLKKFEITKSEEDAIMVLKFLFINRHKGLELLDVDECSDVFENTAFFGKLNTMRALYKISSSYDSDCGFYLPSLVPHDIRRGKIVFIESTNDVPRFLSLTNEIFGEEQMRAFMCDKLLNTWTNDLCETLAINDYANPEICRAKQTKKLMTQINYFLNSLFNNIPLPIIKATNREEMLLALNIVRNSMEREFGKFSFYNTMKADPAHFISKCYLGEINEVNYDQDDDYVTPIINQSQISSQATMDDTLTKLNDPEKSKNMNYLEEMKEYYNNENNRVDTDPHALSKYIEKKMYGTIRDIWHEALKYDWGHQIVSTTKYIEHLFTIVKAIDAELPGFLARIQNKVNGSINHYDPDLLRAADIGIQVPAPAQNDQA